MATRKEQGLYLYSHLKQLEKQSILSNNFSTADNKHDRTAIPAKRKQVKLSL